MADLAFVLSTIAGPDARAPLSIDEPGERFARPLDRSFKGVRVAWFKDLGGVPFDARVRTVVDGHRTTFESLGCIVEQAEPDFAPAEISFRMLRAWNSANTYGARLREHPDAFKDTLKGEIEEGLRLTGTDLARAETAHGQIWRRFQAFLEKYEYFVLPTTQLPPFDINTPYPTEIAGVKFDNYIDWMKSCWYISATGNPAASVPGGFTPEGLPVGVQIVGRDKAGLQRSANGACLRTGHRFRQEAPGHCVERALIARLLAGHYRAHLGLLVDNQLARNVDHYFVNRTGELERILEARTDRKSRPAPDDKAAAETERQRNRHRNFAFADQFLVEVQLGNSRRSFALL